MTWRRCALLAAGAVACVGAIQLVPYGRSHDNPVVAMEPAWDSPSTRSLARAACFDCHSNETTWPRYASIAPVSWLVQSDVDEGRSKLNFSEWRRTQSDARDAGRNVRTHDMPPWYYALMHPAARLSDTDRQALAGGLDATIAADAPGALQPRKP
jgi:hypothetical protein